MRLEWRGTVKSIAGALALAALLLVQAPAAAEAPAAPAPRAAAATAAPRPAIWLLEDEDTRIYLFGTTHMFPRGLRWRSARLDAAIAEADELVLETADEDEISDETFASWMFMTKPVPILARVSADRRPQLERVVAASGLDAETWDRLYSWAAGMMVMATGLMENMTDEQRAGANPFDAMMTGAETELQEEFRRAGKPVSAVESSAFQINLLRGLPPPAQRAFLEMTLDDLERDEAEGSEIPWVSGDVEAIAREMEGLPPVLYEPLLTARNRNWTEWLARRLDRPGTVLFAVGAGHLAGPRSVQTMLAARGLAARRID